MLVAAVVWLLAGGSAPALVHEGGQLHEKQPVRRANVSAKFIDEQTGMHVKQRYTGGW
jgi:hypothetical protein